MSLVSLGKAWNRLPSCRQRSSGRELRFWVTIDFHDDSKKCRFCSTKKPTMWSMPKQLSHVPGMTIIDMCRDLSSTCTKSRFLGVLPISLERNYDGDEDHRVHRASPCTS